MSVGRFFGDGPAGFFECVVPPLGGRIAGFWSRLSAAGEIFLPIQSSCPLSAVLLIGKPVELGRVVLGGGRWEWDGWKTSAPSLGMWGRKILLVGKFFGD